MLVRILLATPLLVLACFTGAAQAAAATSVVMLSDSGDWVGEGQPRLFHPANGSVTVTGNAGHLTVRASGGTAAMRLTWTSRATRADAERRPVRARTARGAA